MLSFEYTMELDFGSGDAGPEAGISALPAMASEHSFTLRCLPQELAGQHILESRIRLEPAVNLTYQKDAYGNRYCYGTIHEPHAVFRVEMTGRAERLPQERERADYAQKVMYRSPSVLTRPGAALRDMHREVAARLEHEGCAPAGGAGYAAALLIRDYVHEVMTYAPGVTSYDTTAEEAAAGRAGVCQDYAQIMLSLCRLSGIPCRYVAGVLIGEGESHAWTEICDGNVWIPMDPTNPGVAWDEQIVFSHGRDARDCKINRGTFLGPAAQRQVVTAAVWKS